MFYGHLFQANNSNYGGKTPIRKIKFCAAILEIYVYKGMFTMKLNSNLGGEELNKGNCVNSIHFVPSRKHNEIVCKCIIHFSFVIFPFTLSRQLIKEICIESKKMYNS